MDINKMLTLRDKIVQCRISVSWKFKMHHAA